MTDADEPDRQLLVVVLERPDLARVTDERGRFRFDGVPVGDWVVATWRPGHRGETRAIGVDAQRIARIGLELASGAGGLEIDAEPLPLATEPGQAASTAGPGFDPRALLPIRPATRD